MAGLYVAAGAYCHSKAIVYFELDVTPDDHVQRALVQWRFEI